MHPDIIDTIDTLSRISWTAITISAAALALALWARWRTSLRLSFQTQIWDKTSMVLSIDVRNNGFLRTPSITDIDLIADAYPSHITIPVEPQRAVTFPRSLEANDVLTLSWYIDMPISHYDLPEDVASSLSAEQLDELAQKTVAGALIDLGIEPKRLRIRVHTTYKTKIKRLPPGQRRRIEASVARTARYFDTAED